MFLPFIVAVTDTDRHAIDVVIPSSGTIIVIFPDYLIHTIMDKADIVRDQFFSCKLSFVFRIFVSF